MSHAGRVCRGAVQLTFAHLVAGSAVTTCTNDLLGRRTSRVTPSGTTTYAWDPEGHLSRITSADATITYAYGITGMRESKTVETSSGTTWTKSVWAGGSNWSLGSPAGSVCPCRNRRQELQRLKDRHRRL